MYVFCVYYVHTMGGCSFKCVHVQRSMLSIFLLYFETSSMKTWISQTQGEQASERLCLCVSNSGITGTHQYVPFLHRCWGLCSSSPAAHEHTTVSWAPTRIGFCRIKFQQLCHGERSDRTLMVSPGAGDQQLPLSPSPQTPHLRAKDKEVTLPFPCDHGMSFLSGSRHAQSLVCFVRQFLQNTFHCNRPVSLGFSRSLNHCLASVGW